MSWAALRAEPSVGPQNVAVQHGRSGSRPLGRRAENGRAHRRWVDSDGAPAVILATLLNGKGVLGGPPAGVIAAAAGEFRAIRPSVLIV